MQQKPEKGVRIRNAKIRLAGGEPAAAGREEGPGGRGAAGEEAPVEGDCAEQAMIEEDPDKMAMLFELY